jgi:hypothetical protein
MRFELKYAQVLPKWLVDMSCLLRAGTHGS